MQLDHNNGSMAPSDLRELIEKRIPNHRGQLEENHSNLENVANFCENNYLNAVDKNKAFEETKQYALQSLAGVAYQINQLARDLSDMLTLQLDRASGLGSQVESINMMVNIQKEKLARREIGVLTTNKSIPKLAKITTPQIQEAPMRYKRAPIDFALLDGVGHGVRSEPPRQPLVSRAPSTISSANNYGHYGQYGTNDYGTKDLRTANIGGNTLSRSSMRSGPSVHSGEHYRVPTIMPLLDPQRYSSAATAQLNHSGSEYGSHSVGTPTDYGSQHGSSEYGGRHMDPMGDKYGTIRAHQHQHMRPQFDLQDGGRPVSPGLPPPPPQLSNYAAYGTITRNDLPPPSAQLLNSTHEDEDLPPPPQSADYFLPPPSSSDNYFDVQPDWIPREGAYMEKVVAIYDYDAVKPDELSLRENCVVYVLRKNDDGWFEGVLDGVTGLFPGNYVRPM